MASEKIFENKVKRFLEEHGCWYVKYWGGSAYTKSGIPDLLVCCHGVFLGIEIKGPKGKASELQLYNLKKIDKASGCGILLYPDDWELFKEFIYALSMDNTLIASTHYEKLKRRWSN